MYVSANRTYRLLMNAKEHSDFYRSAAPFDAAPADPDLDHIRSSILGLTDDWSITASLQALQVHPELLLASRPTFNTYDLIDKPLNTTSATGASLRGFRTFPQRIQDLPAPAGPGPVVIKYGSASHVSIDGKNVPAFFDEDTGLLDIQWPDGIAEGVLVIDQPGSFASGSSAVELDLQFQGFPYHVIRRKAAGDSVTTKILALRNCLSGFHQSLDDMEAVAYLVLAVILSHPQA